MGYETKVYIGKKMPSCPSDEGKGLFFLRELEIDLGKIGHECAITYLASKAESTYNACKKTGNKSRYEKV